MTTTYTYDAAYNRTSEIDTTAGTITKNKTYRYNPRNQLTNVDDNLDSNNNTSYAFDQNGNQIQKVKVGEITNFVFDIRDDLREVQIGGSTVGQFLYNYDGLRIEKIGERGAERSTYDDQSILQQYQVTGCEQVGDANCKSGATGQTRAKFDYGASSLLSLNTLNEPTQFYLYDVLNSVANLTNSEGAVQARYQYDAWGIKRNEVGSSYNRFSFTGYEEDKETGLLYAKARFYDPDTGKFLSEDAYEGDFLMAPSLHRYLYAFQNPTVYTDPTGNIVCGGVCVAGAIVAGITVVDYFTSGRRERVAQQIQPESTGGRLLSDSIALSQSASNTLSFGYFDAVQQQGNQGYVEHTKENILPINASENAYREFTSPDGDNVLGALYVAKGLGQTASLGLGAAGLRNPSASVGRSSADEIGAGGQKTKLVDESDTQIVPTRESVQSELDRLPNNQGAQYGVRQNSNGSFSTVRNDKALSNKINVTDDGALFSPVNLKNGQLHKNDNAYRGDQSVYEIVIDGNLYKYGKADATDLAINGNPNRLEKQVNSLQKKHPNSDISGEVIYNNTDITTKNIKQVETDQVQNYVDEFGEYPPGNQNHPRVKLPE